MGGTVFKFCCGTTVVAFVCMFGVHHPDGQPRSDRAVLAGLHDAACSSCYVPHSQGVTSANSKKLYSENRNVVIVLDILPVILYRNCFRMFHGDGAIGDS